MRASQSAFFFVEIVEMLTALPARRLLAAHVDPDGNPERRRLVEETWGGIERRSPAWTLSCLIAAGGPKYALASPSATPTASSGCARCTCQTTRATSSR